MQGPLEDYIIFQNNGPIGGSFFFFFRSNHQIFDNDVGTFSGTSQLCCVNNFCVSKTYKKLSKNLKPILKLFYIVA